MQVLSAPPLAHANCMFSSKLSLFVIVQLNLVAAYHDSYDIFGEAMAEVLKVMEDNFSNEFRETEAFKALERAASVEAKELELLKQV